MRLIDADELYRVLANPRDLPGDTIDVMVVRLAILLSPTVEAIPKEWIKNYLIPFQARHDSLSEDLKENDGAGWVVDVLETMMREWEKENETN